MPLLLLLEPYSLGIQSSLIGKPCYHYWDELTACLKKISCKDLKVRLKNEERPDVCSYGSREEKPYYRPNYIVQASEHCVRMQ